MNAVEPETVRTVLFHHSDGLLTKFRGNKGIDPLQLARLYELLEAIRADWRYQANISKALMCELNCLVPALYRHLEQYNDSELCEQYKRKIYDLDVAVSMCLDPDPSNSSFDISLDSLRDT